MKNDYKHVLLAATMFCSLGVWGQVKTKAGEKDKGYVVKVKINGSNDSMLLLANYYADKQYLRDSAFRDSKGFFVFKGKTKLEPGMYTVAGQARVKYFDFLIDDVQNMQLETDTGDFNTNMRVTGSTENDVLFEYLHYMQKQYEKMIGLQARQKELSQTNKTEADAVTKEINALDSTVKIYKKDFSSKYPNAFFPKMLKMMVDPEVPEAPMLPGTNIKDSLFQYRYYKTHYWDNVDFGDDRILRTPLFFDKLKRYFDNVIVQNPDTLFKEAVLIIDRTKEKSEMMKYLIWYITNRAESSDIMGMDAGFVYMVDKYYRAGKAFWVDSTTLFRMNDQADKLRLIILGKKAPELKCADSTLANFFPLYNVKAKYTIVVFWDPGCGHCQKEMPKMVDIYDKMLAEKMDVKVYSVCATSSVDEWKKYIREKKHDRFINVIDYDISRKNYNITTTPAFFVLDEDKKIIGKRLVSEQIYDFIKRIDAINASGRKGFVPTVRLVKEEDKE